jgi:quercetin dioxygenase-like cupin family protein
VQRQYGLYARPNERTLAEHAHPDAEETIYIVVGEGTLKIGGRDYSIAASSFATIPRGVSHSMTRRGSRPLMFVSTLIGPPCQKAKQ